MTPAYAVERGIITRKTSVRVQKNDGLPPKTYSMTLARFSLQDNLGRVWFFEETFLLPDISMDIVLKLFFLALSNVDFQFYTEELTWRFYIIVEALPTTSWVKFINKIEFAKRT